MSPCRIVYTLAAHTILHAGYSFINYEIYNVTQDNSVQLYQHVTPHHLINHDKRLHGTSHLENVQYNIRNKNITTSVTKLQTKQYFPIGNRHQSLEQPFHTP